MPIYGFESQDDFNRARDVIRTVEGQRVDLTRTKRGRYPATGGGGNGARPYIITQTDGTVSEGNIAVYRYCGLTDLTAKVAQGTSPLEAVGDDVQLNVQFMHGVSFTGQCVLAQPINGGRQIVGGWLNCFFRGACVDGIDAGDSGTVNLTYVDYLDATQVAPVTALNTLDRALVAEQVVYVWYGTTLTGEGFYIQSAECPI